ncbi:MAG: pyridoxal phosphate-dependent aminotransferase [Christensenellaceae bacterium]|nr:pyridoxal phosphate-dependent aminotransferase [Christensenellaceae bacterium]
MKISKKAAAVAPSATLKIDSAYKQMKASGLDVVGFGAGEPDFDTPAYIKDAAKKALDTGFTKYTPASGTADIKKAVAARMERKYGLKYDADQVIISNGAKHSLYNSIAAITDPGDEIIVIQPYWVTYPELIAMCGGKPVFVEAFEADSFIPKIEAIRAAITEKTIAIILNNPSNPCGCVYDKKTLEAIADLAKEFDLYVISDEIYDELDFNGEFISFPTISEDAKERTILVNGLSKSYAMTGWRIGYTLSSKAIAKAMSSMQSHMTSNPCSIAQFAGTAALEGPQDDLKAMIATFGERKNLICSLINDIDLISCVEPKGAFYVFANISKVKGKKLGDKEITNSLEFADILLSEELVAVVPGAAFGNDDYIRLSYATSEENIKKGLGRIKDFCLKLK